MNFWYQKSSLISDIRKYFLISQNGTIVWYKKIRCVAKHTSTRHKFQIWTNSSLMNSLLCFHIWNLVLARLQIASPHKCIMNFKWQFFIWRNLHGPHAYPGAAYALFSSDALEGHDLVSPLGITSDSITYTTGSLDQAQHNRIRSLELSSIMSDGSYSFHL